MNFLKIYLVLVLILQVGCAVWLIRDLFFRKQAEAAAPLMVAGVGSLLLTFVYVLAAIVQDQISS